MFDLNTFTAEQHDNRDGELWMAARHVRIII
jgi:hypothetical protein